MKPEIRMVIALEQIAGHLKAIRGNTVAERLAARYGISYAEARVGFLLVRGKSRKQIAATLGVSENTIKNQLHSMFAKVGVRRQPQLAVAFLAEGAEA